MERRYKPGEFAERVNRSVGTLRIWDKKGANAKTLSPQQELVEDLMAVIHCFSCRLYGLRKYKNEISSIITETEPNNIC